MEKIKCSGRRCIFPRRLRCPTKILGYVDIWRKSAIFGWSVLDITLPFLDINPINSWISPHKRKAALH